MPENPLRLLILGAHPDDAEFHAGGLAAIYRQAGHHVRMISVTNGESGHFRISGKELANIRRTEARAAGKVIGATYDTWDYPDGRLQPTIEVRERIIREIRGYQPDLVLTHRLNDYHPDHRAVGQAVQDASYLVTVPPICADVPALRRDPVVGYLPDMFTRPAPLRGDIVLDIGDQMETIVQMLAAHRSQFFEWLPYNERRSTEVPYADDDKIVWLRRWYEQKIAPRTERYRNELTAQYGPDHGPKVAFCEVFEISEYAAPLDAEARRRLFWFL